MKEFTIPMALVDYIPVFLFGIAAVILLKDLYNKMSKGAFALFAAGTIDVFAAGFLKATYKFLYAAKICDFEVLSTLLFPLQAIGFTLAGAGILAMMLHKQSPETGLCAAAAAPTVFSGTVIFIVLMVLGLAGINTSLSILSVKLKKPWVITLFVLAFAFSLAMGYLSSQDFTQGYMNWIAQGVNILGQGCLLGGTLLLHKAGLKDYQITYKQDKKEI